MRTFELHRDEDVSGVSGTGKVAEGVEFSDGTVVLRWLTRTGSVAVYLNGADMEKVHGHDGRTRVVWGTTDETTQPHCPNCGLIPATASGIGHAILCRPTVTSEVKE